MVRHGGITASVVVDGAELPEYKTKYDSKMKVLSCWIPSEVGKTFKIRFKMETPDYDSRTEFYADGMHLNCVVAWKQNKSFLTSCGSARTSADGASPLLFARNVATEDGATKASSQQGVLCIRHCSVEKLERVTKHQEPLIFKFPKASANKEDVPHIASFGKEQICPPPTRPTHRVKEIKCLITFLFLYRPMKAIRAFITAPPAPAADEVAEIEADEDSSDDEYVEDAADDESAADSDSVEGDRPSRRSVSSRKRRASSEVSKSESETDSDSEAVDTADEDDMAEMQRLKRKIKIQKMELRFSKLKQRRKKRKLNAEELDSFDEKNRDSATPVKKKKSVLKRRKTVS